MVMFIALLLLLPLTGCNARQKIADKVADKITEGIVNKVAGDDVDVDIDGDKVTIKGDDGSEMTFGGTEWPKDGAASMIPEFKEGKLDTVINSAENCWLQVKDVNEADYEKYIEALKGVGFDASGSEYKDAESRIYSAYKGEELLITVTYSSDNTMVINAMKPAGQ